jgi:hypothetical protein
MSRNASEAAGPAHFVCLVNIEYQQQNPGKPIRPVDILNLAFAEEAHARDFIMSVQARCLQSYAVSRANFSSVSLLPIVSRTFVFPQTLLDRTLVFAEDRAKDAKG